MEAKEPSPSTSGDEPWLPLGKHRYRMSGAQLQLQSVGEFTPSDAAGLMELLRELRTRSPRCTLLFDAKGGLSAPASTRRVFVEQSTTEYPTIPTAVLGTGVIVRTLFRLTLEAMRLLTRRSFPVDFFASEAEAQAWLKQTVLSHYGPPSRPPETV